MNYIIAAGFIGTGSSVICDLLKEVRGFKDTEVEFKLLTAPGGLIDLENALFDNWNPWRSGQAICDFEQICNNLSSGLSSQYDYSNVFSDSFMTQVKKFIGEISSGLYSFGSSIYKFDCEPVLSIPLKKINYKLEIGKRKEERAIYFSDVEKELFFEASKSLIDSLFVDLEAKGIHTVVLDQGLLPYHVDKLDSYFPNAKMVIIDRNPLDTAHSMITRYKGIGVELRRNLDPELYARWFIKTRQCMKRMHNKNVKCICYEDIIKNYNSCTKEIFDWLDIDEEDHIEKNRYFDPNESVKRIDKWKSFDGEPFCSKEQWIDFCNRVNEILNEKLIL